MKDFSGKICFITGGGSGAGFGQAKVFAEAGCKIVIADVRRDHLEEAMAYFKDRKTEVHGIHLDITDRQAYKEAADEVEKVYKSPPQLLFNTAGVNILGPAEASTYEDFDWLLGVNLGGVINGMVTFIPRMIQAGKGGHIATTSSMSGFMAGATSAPYAAAKAAVNSLMESYYQALKPYHIGVSCLCPGSIKSNIAEATFTRPKHFQNTGYYVDDDVIDSLRDFYAQGMDPVELAQVLKKGIENELLFIIPLPEPENILRTNFERIIDYTTPEGIQRQELKKQHMKEVDSGNVKSYGWGKARPDISWIKENPYAHLHD